MSKSRIALITGANRGIGREVARQLHVKGFQVILTARDARAAREAAHELDPKFQSPKPMTLDVADENSIHAAAHAFADAGFRHLDVLINNAGILLDENKNALNVEPQKILDTFRTNTLGSLLVARAFKSFLIAAPNGRIINVSSGGGSLAHMTNWAPAYSISKAALNAVTRQLAASLSGKGIAVNSVCPGWVRTRMGGPRAPRSLEQGAETIVWLATEAPQSFTGKFFGDGKREVAW